MEKQQLIDAIDNFFADTSRPPEKTRSDLEDVIAHAEMLVDTLPSGDVGN
jgi:hypothetical protein